MSETVNHPRHYNAHPSGIECIDVVEHMGFNLGNAIKYLWRADEKGNAIEDLRKAAWYVQREIERRSQGGHVSCQETATVAGGLFVCVGEHDDDRHVFVSEDRA